MCLNLKLKQRKEARYLGGILSMKSVRHAMILDIIESADIETQEELADELS